MIESTDEYRRASMMDSGELLKIIVSADKLEDWLGKNSGTTDDWPVKINADNESSAVEMATLMNGLHDALKPYRATVIK